MNERIRELAEQAKIEIECDDYGEIRLCEAHGGSLEKFAQLIVEECVECLMPLSRNHSMVGAAQDTIKEHFGVE